MKQTNLELYNNAPYHPGGNAVKRVLWYYVNSVFFKSSLVPFYAFKNFLLRLFGAEIGKQVEIKPCVNIKYPWHLTIGNEVWIGENVWLDNLVPIVIGNHVCISQGAVLLTGNHNYTKESFDLMTAGISVGDGAWIGAFAVVNSGVTVGSHAVLTTGSVATRPLEAYGIYRGNPAVKIRRRIIR
jgi:putative colanic acid biosynthesis acetyltransferase WcaF